MPRFLPFAVIIATTKNGHDKSMEIIGKREIM
jgi:hypothetical protein